MELFEVVENKAVPSVHALMASPFKEVWDKDTSKNKDYATKVFSYVELVCNPVKSNPFSGYTQEERPIKVMKQVFGHNTTELPVEMLDDIITCNTAYINILQDGSPSYGLYVDAVNAVEKLRLFLRNFNLSERTPHGAMVLKPADVANMLVKLPDIERTMQIQRDKVHAELTNKTKTRNQREIGYFER